MDTTSTTEPQQPHLKRWLGPIGEPVLLGVIAGSYLWVAGAPFGFLHPEDEGWWFFWRLPPVWRLPILVGLSVAAVWAFFFAFASLRRRRNGCTTREAMQSFRRLCSPLYFLTIGLIQLVPGGMEFLPVLPLLNKLILPIAVFSSVLFLFVLETNLVPSNLFRRFDRSISSHMGRWSLAIFVISLLAYGIFMKRCNTVYGYTGGDEAHYLTQARSLGEDLDRDLVNQLPDYTRTRQYHRAKHLSLKSAPGKAYSYHSAGLPVLLAPGWAVGKMKGAMAILLLISSVFAMTVFRIAYQLRGRSEFAISSWGIFCFTTPVIFYACRAYPELPSALMILFVVWRMGKAELLTRWGWVALGCLLGYLPWLHIPRLSIPTLLLSVWGIVWLFFREKKTNLAFFVPPLVMSVVLLIVLNQHWYGYSWDASPGASGFEKLDPQAWVGGYRNAPREVLSCFPGLIGSIMDRYRGLLVCSPVYFIPLVCLFLGLFSRKLKFWRMLWFWVFFAIYIPALGRKGWYGGACFPSRFLIAALPMLLFAFAAILSSRRDRLIRAMFAVLAAFSVWFTARMLLHPAHFYRGAESAHQYSPAAKLIGLFYPYAGTSRPLYHIEDPFGVLLFFVWVGGAVALIQWARRKERPWHGAFNLCIAAILALPLFSTLIRRLTNHHPYQFSISDPLEHYSTLIGINRLYSERLRAAGWGKIRAESFREELTLELPAVEEKSRTGDVEMDESVGEKVVVYDPAKHKPGYLCYTRPVKVHQGEYVAQFWLAIEGWHARNSVILQIQDMETAKTVASRQVTSSDLPEAKTYASVPLRFSLNRYSKLSFMVDVDTSNPVRLLKFSVEPSCLPELLSAVTR